MLCWSISKKKQREINFLNNGSLLLEELIASSGGKYNPIRMFSSHQIRLATNNFRWRYNVVYDSFVWYKGMIENRDVLIKKYYKDELLHSLADNIYRDIAVSSMMSSHKNVLKILGCCLEFRRPALVYEYPEKDSLLESSSARIKPLPWNVRLKIAKEVADAVTYLHTEFPRTIIHRDLQPSNIFLDENLTAKLSSFSLSILIPEGETGVNDMVCGRTGYAEPGYVRTGFVTENVDVYNFGFIMLRLVTGKAEFIHNPGIGETSGPLPDYVEKCLEQGSFTKLIDSRMLNSADEDIPLHSRLQMEACVELAMKCVKTRPGEDKPRMIDVAKELKRIAKQT